MSTAENKLKLIIDNDSGVDDALAMMLALSRPDLCEVIAITCVHGNTPVDNVCDNVLRVCKACDVTKIDIYRGCEQPIVNEIWEEEFFGADGLSNTSEELEKADIPIKEEHASIALVRLAKQYTKEITLVAIGPLTNIAVAQRLDSSFLSNLKELIIMGGNINAIGNVTATAEYNFYADPEAAYMVLSSENTCPFTIVPWETCRNHEMPREWFNKWQNTNTKKGSMVKKVMKTVVNYANTCNYPSVGDADVLAVATAIFPAVVTKSIERKISVELRGEKTRGQTVVENRPKALWSDDIKHMLRKIIVEFDDFVLAELRDSIVN